MPIGDPIVPVGVDIVNRWRWKGFPYEGEPVALRNGDPPFLQPSFTAQGKCEIFELWNEEHLKAYNGLLSEVAQELKFISMQNVQWIEGKQNWKVMISWIRPYYTTPDKVRTELSYAR